VGTVVAVLALSLPLANVKSPKKNPDASDQKNAKENQFVGPTGQEFDMGVGQRFVQINFVHN
jgi:hypothetical protein